MNRQKITNRMSWVINIFIMLIVFGVIFCDKLPVEPNSINPQLEIVGTWEEKYPFRSDSAITTATFVNDSICNTLVTNKADSILFKYSGRFVISGDTISFQKDSTGQYIYYNFVFKNNSLYLTKCVFSGSGIGHIWVGPDIFRPSDYILQDSIVLSKKH
jgi:hypothetical protein